MMTGSRRVDVYNLSGPVASSKTQSTSTSKIDQRIQALCNLTADTKTGETTEEEKEKEKKGISNSSFGTNDDDNGVGYVVYRGTRRFLRARTCRLWEELDKQRLLA